MVLAMDYPDHWHWRWEIACLLSRVVIAWFLLVWANPKMVGEMVINLVETLSLLECPVFCEDDRSLLQPLTSLIPWDVIQTAYLETDDFGISLLKGRYYHSKLCQPFSLIPMIYDVTQRLFYLSAEALKDESNPVGLKAIPTLGLGQPS